MNGKGEIEYVANPQPHGDIPNPDGGADPNFYATTRPPMPAQTT